MKESDRMMKSALPNNPYEMCVRAATAGGGRRLRTLPFVIILLCLAVPSVGAQQDALWNIYLESASKALERKDHAEAERRLKLALEKAWAFGGTDHRVALTLSKFVALYLPQKKYAEAEPLYKQALAIWQTDTGPEPAETARVIERTAQFYQEAEKYVEAEPLHQLALALRRKSLKPNDLELAESLLGLADNYNKQRKYVEAEPLYAEALKIKEQHPDLGPDDLATLTVALQLGSNYRARGNFAETERLFKHVQTAVERRYGAGHPYAYDTLEVLFWLYREKEGRDVDAEAAMKRAISIMETNYGLKDPRIGKSLAALAEFYISRKKYDLAEPLYKRALDIAVSAWEKELPSKVAEVAVSMADLYREKGEYAKAEPYLNRAIAIKETDPKFGPDHPSVGSHWHILGETYHRQNKLDDAEAAYRRALAVAEKRGDEGRAAAAHLHQHLGNIYGPKGRYAAAEASFKRSLAIYEKLPDEAAALVDVQDDLAALYRFTGHYNEAEVLAKKNLTLIESAEIDKSDAHVNALGTLGLIQQSLGKRAESLASDQKALAIAQGLLPPEHQWLAKLLNNVAKSYYYLGMYTEAEPLYERAIAIASKQFGEQDVSTAWYRKNLALLLYAQGKEGQAEPLFQEALKTMANDKGDGGRIMAQSWCELAELHATKGQNAEAERLFQKAAKMYEEVLGSAHPTLAECLEKYAAFLRRIGRGVDASAAESRVKAIRDGLFRR